MAERLGSSEKYLYIDLTETVPPFTFQEAFAAAYPTSGALRGRSSCRCIVAVDGPGTLTLTDAEGDDVEWPMQAYETNNIAAVGVAAADGITLIKVML